MTTVLRHCAGRVGHLTLNRPEARNAVTVELATALDRASTAMERFATRGGVT